MQNDLSETDAEQLFRWVQESDENTRHFVRVTSLHADLRTVFTGQKTVASDPDMPQVDPAELRPQSRNSLSRREVWLSVSVATSLLLIVAAALFFLDLPQNNHQGVASKTTFATVCQLQDATWSGSELQVGDRIGTSEVELLSGHARFILDDGVEVTLSAPAKFELLRNGRTRLSRGRLIAAVPPGAIGFTVLTPAAEAVDLGTAFSVFVTEQGESTFSVLDGEIQLFPENNGPNWQILSAGEQAAIAVGDTELTNTNFDVTEFQASDMFAAGLRSVSQHVGVRSQWSDFRTAPKAPITVTPEGYARVLSSPVDVDLAWGHESHSIDLQRLKTYAINVNTTGDAVEGRIEFERPIAGVILNNTALERSDDRFGSGAAPAIGDDKLTVSFSEDGHVLELKAADSLEITGRLRVLVDETYSDIPATQLAISTAGAPEGLKQESAINTKSDDAEPPLTDGSDPPAMSPGNDNSLNQYSGIHPRFRQLLRTRDRNGDGRLSPEEMPPPMVRIFARLDQNSDGYVTPNELSGGLNLRGPRRPPGQF